MELFEAIKTRRSVRAFKAHPVPMKALQRAVESAAYAPSPLNSQPWYFRIVTGEKREVLKSIISKTTLFIKDIVPDITEEKMDFLCRFISDLGGAPAIVVMTTPRSADEYLRKVDWLACGCAMQNFLLAAHGEGLGCVSLTIALWVENELCSKLGIPAGEELVSIILVGEPAEAPATPPRNLDIADWL